MSAYITEKPNTCLKINILSNILLNSPFGTNQISPESKSEDTTTCRKNLDTVPRPTSCSQEEDQALQELPLSKPNTESYNQCLYVSTKELFSSPNNSVTKTTQKRKLSQSQDTDDDGQEELVFNYMTGLYEKAKKSKQFEEFEDVFIDAEVKDEISIEETILEDVKLETTPHFPGDECADEAVKIVNLPDVSGSECIESKDSHGILRALLAPGGQEGNKSHNLEEQNDQAKTYYRIKQTLACETDVELETTANFPGDECADEAVKIVNLPDDSGSDCIESNNIESKNSHGILRALLTPGGQEGNKSHNLNELNDQAKTYYRIKQKLACETDVELETTANFPGDECADEAVKIVNLPDDSGTDCIESNNIESKDSHGILRALFTPGGQDGNQSHNLKEQKDQAKTYYYRTKEKLACETDDQLETTPNFPGDECADEAVKIGHLTDDSGSDCIESNNIESRNSDGELRPLTLGGQEGNKSHNLKEQNDEAKTYYYRTKQKFTCETDVELETTPNFAIDECADEAVKIVNLPDDSGSDCIESNNIESKNSHSILRALLSPGGQEGNESHNLKEQNGYAKAYYYRTKQKLACETCGFLASTKQQLIVHLYKMHLQDECSLIFLCKFCEYKSNSECFVSEHLKDHKEVVEDEMCKNVELSLSKKTGESEVIDVEKSDGVIIELLDSDYEENGFTYKCFHCKFFSFSELQLKVHALQHYGKTYICSRHKKPEEKCPKCVYVRILKNTPKKYFFCPNCTYKTLYSAEYSIHQTKCKKQLNKSSLNRLKCYHCSYSTRDTHLLKEHAFKHHGSTFTCRIHLGHSLDCERCLYEVILLEINKKGVYVCVNCNFKSSRVEAHICEPNGESSATSGHLSIPKENEEPHGGGYICYDCQPLKKFLRASELQKHVEKHGESTFHCYDHNILHVYCKKCIYQYAVMSIKLKSYICKFCSFKNCTLDALLTHMRGNCKSAGELSLLSWLGFLPCYDCGFLASTRKELSDHALIHRSSYECLDHLEQPKKGCLRCFYTFIVNNPSNKLYECLFCSRSFSSVYLWRSHVDDQHGEMHQEVKCLIHKWTRSKNCSECIYKKNFVSRNKRVRCRMCSVSVKNCNMREHFLRAHFRRQILFHDYRCPEHIFKKQCAFCYICYMEMFVNSYFKKPREYRCMECDYTSAETNDLEYHIKIWHYDSSFHCTKHTLSDINRSCDECLYEHLVLVEV